MKKILIILITTLVCIGCTADAEWNVAELQIKESISVLTPSIVQISLDFDNAVKPMIESVGVQCTPENDPTNVISIQLTKEMGFTFVQTNFIPEQRYNITYLINPSYLQQREYISSFVTHCNALPKVVTSNADNLTPVTANLHGTVEKGVSGYTITEYGFYYSLLPTGEYERHKVMCGKNSDGCSYSATIDTLRAGATYYYYAYATNCNGITYGDTLTFTLPKTY